MLLLLVILVLILFISLKYVCDYWLLVLPRKTKDIPGPEGYPIIGNMTFIWGEADYAFMKLRECTKRFIYGFKLDAGGVVGVNINDPEDAEIILSSKTVITKSYLYRFLNKWLRDGLLTSSGAKWHLRRKILTPAFHFNILQQFTVIFAEQSEYILNVLEEKVDQEIDIVPYINDFTLYSICETTMGIKAKPKSQSMQEYKSAIQKFGHILLYRGMRFWLYPDSIFYKFSSYGFEALRLLKTLHTFTSNVIDEKLQNWDESILQNIETPSGKKRLAMLDLLILEMKKSNIDYEGLKEEVDTFMFEGHDTTASAISFSLFLLANHRSEQDKIFEELKRIFGDSDRSVTFQDLQEMAYLECCLKESLRLYPPVHFISRNATEDIQLKHFFIPEGCALHVHIFDIHRNPKYWPEPTKFDPDRFLPENVVDRHPFAYIPFSAGLRNCIGQRFALLELKALVSTILRKFILESIDTPETITLKPDFVIRSKHGLKMVLRRRIANK